MSGRPETPDFEIKTIDGEEYVFIPMQQWRMVSDMNSTYAYFPGESSHLILKKQKQPAQSKWPNQTTTAR